MSQAVILAGGRATRMRPYTEDRPKAMIEVAGSPIIERQIRWLAAKDVRDVVISCGYRAEIIEEHLGDGSRLGVTVTIAREEEPLGRGGALRYSAGFLPRPNEMWMGLNGDVITDFEIPNMIEHHDSLRRDQDVAATVALARFRTSWGVADLDGQLIRRFVEKPELPYWINAGIYCFEPEVTELLPEKGDHEESTFPRLASEGRLGWFGIEGYWRGIDTLKDIEEAAADLEGS